MKNKGGVNKTYWYSCLLCQDFAGLTHVDRDRMLFNFYKRLYRLLLIQPGKQRIWAFVAITKFSTWGQHVLSFKARRSAMRFLLMVSC